MRAKSALELVHTDLADPIDPESREGFKYVLSLTDDYPSAVCVYFLKYKSDTVDATERFLADIAPYGTPHVSGLTMALNLLDRGIKRYFTGTESDMKHQHHTHHTRTALLSATGGHFLIWLDAYP